MSKFKLRGTFTPNPICTSGASSLDKWIYKVDEKSCVGFHPPDTTKLGTTRCSLNLNIRTFGKHCLSSSTLFPLAFVYSQFHIFDIFFQSRNSSDSLQKLNSRCLFDIVSKGGAVQLSCISADLMQQQYLRFLKSWLYIYYS